MEALGLKPIAPLPRPDIRPPRTASSATPRYTQNTLPPVVPPDEIITACLRVLTSLLGLGVSSKLGFLRKHVLQVLPATNKENHRSVTHPIVAPHDTGKLSMVNTIYFTVEDLILIQTVSCQFKIMKKLGRGKLNLRVTKLV